MRHIDTQCLWIQQRVRDGTIELVKVRGDDNPADLFTKHLQSRERIHSLLAFFGCVYTNGRAELAPQLRAGTGTTKGELLALAEKTMVWQGVTFPAVEFEGETLPEAFLSEPGVLPHFHSDEKTRYPKATVHHHPSDEDPLCGDSFETRGTTLGQQQPRRAPHRNNGNLALSCAESAWPAGRSHGLKSMQTTYQGTPDGLPGYQGTPDGLPPIRIRTDRIALAVKHDPCDTLRGNIPDTHVRGPHVARHSARQCLSRD